ncbi:hypothetical protein AVEN_147145-1, partial [Araneus ventricosus]
MCRNTTNNHEFRKSNCIAAARFVSGPAVCLYEKPYYENLQRALKPDGLLLSQ